MQIYLFPVQDDSKVYPQIALKEHGTMVSFSCNSYYWNVKWFFPTMSNLISLKNPLIIKNLTKYNSGKYYCYGSYANNLHFISAATLEVISKYVLSILVIKSIYCTKVL